MAMGMYYTQGLQKAVVSLDLQKQKILKPGQMYVALSVSSDKYSESLFDWIAQAGCH